MVDSKKNLETKQCADCQSNEARRDDRLSLRKGFYQAYDPSMLQNLLMDHTRLTGLSARGKCIGQGTHFQSFQIDGRGPLSLVLSVATSEFAGGLVSGHQTWYQAMTRLKSLDLPLVPPFEILRHERADHATLGFVTPFGRQKQEKASSHWQPLDGLINGLHAELHKNQLCLQDVVQIRCAEGIPFVIDWSDLIFI